MGLNTMGGYGGREGGVRQGFLYNFTVFGEGD